MSQTIQLNYSYSKQVGANLSYPVGGTATVWYEYNGLVGMDKTQYRVSSIYGKSLTGTSSGNYYAKGEWSDTRSKTLPADFSTAISVTGDTSLIVYGTTADGTRVSFDSTNILDFFNAVGPNGRITCMYEDTYELSGPWSASISDVSSWNPDVGSTTILTGANDDLDGFTASSSGSGTYRETVTDTASGSSRITLTYLTEAEANRGKITVTPTAATYPMNTTVEANVVVSGTEASYFTITWLLHGNAVVTDPTHYPIVDRMVSTDAYVENILRWDDNLAGVIATVYTADGEELASALANFIVVGPSAPPTVFNIEKFGVGIGQVAEGTEENPLLTIDYNTKFTQKVVARHGFTMSDGWHPLTLASGISGYDCGAYGSGAAYRVEGGNHVYVAAGVGGFTARTDLVTIATDIPEEYRPRRNVWFLAYCQTGGEGTKGLPRVYRCVVTSDGNIEARCEYHIGSTSGRTDSITYADMLCEYWLDA